MIIDINKMKRDVIKLKKQHASFTDADMYNFEKNGIYDPDEIYTDEYQSLCNRILAMDAIIYNSTQI